MKSSYSLRLIEIDHISFSRVSRINSPYPIINISLLTFCSIVYRPIIHYTFLTTFSPSLHYQLCIKIRVDTEGLISIGQREYIFFGT